MQEETGCKTCNGRKTVLCEDGPTETGDVRQWEEPCPDCVGIPVDDDSDTSGATEGDR